MYSRCIVLISDGARPDVMKRLLDAGELPQFKKHIVDRGCFRTALSVFPSTTGPAHIPFITGLHPGTANVPGYRWLSRTACDAGPAGDGRHRSYNGPSGIRFARDLDPEVVGTLFEHFRNPTSIFEPVDLCRESRLYRLVWRRMFYTIRAHYTHNWRPVDDLVERTILHRLNAGSDCIVATFLGVDEYSHLVSPFSEETVLAYKAFDRAIGRIAEVLHRLSIYDETVLAVVSDHGLTPTQVHIPLAQLVEDGGLRPLYYPKTWRRNIGSAVMESGNAMAHIYFRRDGCWGDHWTYGEMIRDGAVSELICRLKECPGVSFIGCRTDTNSVMLADSQGAIHSRAENGTYAIEVSGTGVLTGHPTGTWTACDLLDKTFDDMYPDAVNQLHKLLASPRSGDLVISTDPGYDLRLKHEWPEHKGSHGSLHREHMHVPFALSVPVEDGRTRTADMYPTLLNLLDKHPHRPVEGRVLEPLEAVPAY